jgi:signal transduction histidine kinase
MSKIFHSLFTLTYNNKDIEASYQKILSKNLRRRNIIYILLTLAMLIISTILFWLFDDSSQNLYFFKILSLTVSGTLIIILIILLIYKNSKITKIISYINFYLLLYQEILLKSYFLYIEADVTIVGLLMCLLYLYILTWYYTCTIDFLPGCLITFAKCLSYYIIMGPIIPLKFHFRIALIEITMIKVCMFSYFYVYEKRKSFYYYKIAETHRHWYHSVLENMKTGFISLTRDGDVMYINKSLQKHLDNILSKENTNVETQSILNDSVLNQNTLDALFKYQQFVSEYEMPDLNGSAFEKVKEFLKATSFENYVLIGTNSIHNENVNLHFEVCGRYCVDRHQDCIKESFEFIFNDITLVKSNEEINAEFKFKSMFLAKVAHEFKNPILCVTELVNQIEEKLEPVLSNNLVDLIYKLDLIKDVWQILNNIKSMNDYLLILIKDMDYFSIKNSHIKKEISLDKEKVYINALINFLKNITIILLKKFDKENSIRFSIDTISLPEEIYTDEIKLKQILINLLSNAVKYTMNGSITLVFEYKFGKINFEVIDTGRGISPSQKLFLFKPYIEQNKDYNHIGAGLGLSIVKELVELLGDEIKYEPNQPEGSRFSFSINVTGNSSNVISSRDIHEEGMPSIDHNDSYNKETVILDYYYPSLIDNQEPLQVNSKSSIASSSLEMSSIQYVQKQYNVLITDDEAITRKSTIRLIKNFSNAYSINVNFIEANDGIECLYKYYKCLRSGNRICFIISDQYMDYMNGATSAKAIYDIMKSKNFTHVPFFLVTAYESFMSEENSGIDGIYTKPLTKKNLEDIFFKTNLLEHV